MNPSRSIRTAAVLAIIFFAASLLAAGCGQGKREEGRGSEAQPVVNKVDHLVLLSHDPGQLHAFFTQTLGLPAAWPYNDYGSFASGGVCAGNANLECIRFGADSPFQLPGEDSAIFGLVFEPSGALADITGELEARGTAPGRPQDQMGGTPDQPVKLWTSLFLDALCTDSYVVYLCEYSTAYRQRLRESASRWEPPLGGIGLVSVEEVTVSAKDPAKTGAAWDAFLAPYAGDAQGLYRVGDGPGIRLRAGESDALISLVLKVSSLEAARSFLAERCVGCEESGGRLTVDPAAVQGIKVILHGD